MTEVQMMTVAPMATIASMATMVPMAMITIGANVINADKSPMPIYCHNYFLMGWWCSGFLLGSHAGDRGFKSRIRQS